MFPPSAASAAPVACGLGSLGPCRNLSTDLYGRVQDIVRKQGLFDVRLNEKDVSLFGGVPERLLVLMHEEMYQPALKLGKRGGGMGCGWWLGMGKMWSVGKRGGVMGSCWDLKMWIVVPLGESWGLVG